MQFKLIYLAKRNPAIKPADWPRAWRSHAIYCSQFPAINETVPSLFYCHRMLEPRLDGTLVDVPEASREYDGVGIVAAPQPVRVGLSAELQAKIDEDELRVFASLSPRFSFHCREVLVEGGAPGKAAVIRFLARRSGSTLESFAAHWNGRHAEIACCAVRAVSSVTRHVHNALTGPPPAGYHFDGIAETWFTTAENAIRSFRDDGFAAVTDDIGRFCDVERSVTMLTSVFHRWPRADA